jgi:hypothetical protein
MPVVLIDCPPNLGFITRNGIEISDDYLIPTGPDKLSGLTHRNWAYFPSILGGRTFAQWAKEQKSAHPKVAKFDQRLKWGVGVFLSGYFTLYTDEKLDFLKRFEAFLTAEKDLLKAE